MASGEEDCIVYAPLKTFASSERNGEKEEEGMSGRESWVEGYGDVVWCDVLGFEWSGVEWVGLGCLGRRRGMEGNVLAAGWLLSE